MDIIAIEKQTWEQMVRRFKEHQQLVRELCGRKDNPKDWLDNQDVCQLLNISKRQLQYYRDSGKLPFSQLGYKCYYKRVDVEKLIEKSYTKPISHGNPR